MSLNIIETNDLSILANSQIGGPSEEQRPKVAVCLAAYNGIRWLGQQLDSILNQRNVSVTVFISVDQSADGTEAFVESLAKSNDRIVQLPQGVRFGGAAANFFRLLGDVDFGGFDYVSLADQDDIWFEDKLSRAIDILTGREPGFDCYSSNVVAFWEDDTRKLIDKAQPQRKWDFVFEAAGPGCTYVLKVSVVAELKPLLLSFQEQISKIGLHDWFIYAFSRAKGYKWFIDPVPSMLYRQHSSNQVGVNSGLRAYLWRSKKVFGGWAISQARQIVQLVGLSGSSFYRWWSRPGRLGMLWLAANAFRCRRGFKDGCIFGIVCLFLFVVGDRSDG
jgi:rhamnosyltransferase